MLVIHTERLPLLVIEFRETLDLPEVEQYGAGMAALFAKQVRHATVVVTDDLPMPSVAALKQLGAWVKQHEGELGTYNLGSALVLQSAVLRGALRFVNTLAASPSPQAVFADRREAEAWAIAKLHAVGLEPGLAKVS